MSNVDITECNIIFIMSNFDMAECNIITNWVCDIISYTVGSELFLCWTNIPCNCIFHVTSDADTILVNLHKPDLQKLWQINLEVKVLNFKHSYPLDRCQNKYVVGRQTSMANCKCTCLLKEQGCKRYCAMIAIHLSFYF